MLLNYNKSESSVRPQTVDDTSSKSVVYIRKDVVERASTDESTGETTTYYEYQEAKLTREEYEQYLRENGLSEIQKIKADLDYLAICAGVDMEV